MVRKESREFVGEVVEDVVGRGIGRGIDDGGLEEGSLV
jgi:hypothetical protein